MSFNIEPGYGYSDDIRELFNEYTQMLIDGDETFRAYLGVQNYDEEILHLEHKYGLPEGRLYILFANGKTAGCIAMKKIDAQSCEMKRLYVRPEFRGNGFGRILAEKVIGEARREGYKSMLLDTLPFLRSAVKLYESLGFYEIEQYNDSPMQSAIYMKLEL